MQVMLTQPDGLHLNARATLRQLAASQPLPVFADGLLAAALAATNAPEQTLAAALRQPDPRFNPLLATLLALDAEVTANINDERRVFPLPGFLTYRTRLPLDQFPPNTLRLPPLNANGHYLHAAGGDGRWVVVRADVHPGLRVAGHVRVVVSDLAGPPYRLYSLEHRLDRQPLDAALLAAALATEAPNLNAAALAHLATTLQRLLP